MTKTTTKTKTQKKCLKHPTYAIFLKSWWLTHSKYDDRYLTLVILFTPVTLVTLVTLFQSYIQFYRAKCITVSGFLVNIWDNLGKNFATLERRATFLSNIHACTNNWVQRFFDIESRVALYLWSRLICMWEHLEFASYWSASSILLSHPPRIDPTKIHTLETPPEFNIGRWPNDSCCVGLF